MQRHLSTILAHRIPVLPFTDPWTDPPTEAAFDTIPFRKVAIPTGNLFSGHSFYVKMEEHVQMFGGTVGESCDPCYHPPCDRADQINKQVLEELSDAAAHGVLTLANMADPAQCAIR